MGAVPSGDSSTPDGTREGLQGTSGSAQCLYRACEETESREQGFTRTPEHTRGRRPQGSWLPCLFCLPHERGHWGRKRGLQVWGGDSGLQRSSPRTLLHPGVKNSP